MKILAFSDLHLDMAAAASVVERSADADVVVGAGDFAVQRRGLASIIALLSEIATPTVVVSGNGESPEELRAACAGWDAARVLHGSAVTIDGVPFFGLGGAVPVTPFGDWSYDLSEDEAAALLQGCPDRAVVVSHSPPSGHVDTDSSGRHCGSRSVLEAIRRTSPKLVVCGHIHASWTERSTEGETLIVNAGPEGTLLEI